MNKTRPEMHLIDEYKVAANTVTCTCSWRGPASDFKKHRAESPLPARRRGAGRSRRSPWG